ACNSGRTRPQHHAPIHAPCTRTKFITFLAEIAALGRSHSIGTGPVKAHVLAGTAYAVPFEAESLRLISCGFALRCDRTRADFRSGRIVHLHPLSGQKRRTGQSLTTGEKLARDLGSPICQVVSDLEVNAG